MKYQLHSVRHTESFKSHLLGRLLALGIGATLGFYMGAMVVIGEIQASIQPVVTQDTPSTLSVQPVTTQHFSDLTESDDLQPALGVGMVQIAAPTEKYQPTTVTGGVQPTARTGAYQHTAIDSQVQGEPLTLVTCAWTAPLNTNYVLCSDGKVQLK